MGIPSKGTAPSTGVQSTQRVDTDEAERENADVSVQNVEERPKTSNAPLPEHAAGAELSEEINAALAEPAPLLDSENAAVIADASAAEFFPQTHEEGAEASSASVGTPITPRKKLPRPAPGTLRFPAPGSHTSLELKPELAAKRGNIRFSLEDGEEPFNPEEDANLKLQDVADLPVQTVIQQTAESLAEEEGSPQPSSQGDNTGSDTD